MFSNAKNLLVVLIGAIVLASGVSVHTGSTTKVGSLHANHLAQIEAAIQ
jgi:hypothetical protein